MIAATLGVVMCSVLFGFLLGVRFVLGGGLYVTRLGTVDVRWPRGRGARLPRETEDP